MATRSDSEKRPLSDTDKLSILIPRWIGHNREHIREKERWLRKLMHRGLDEAGRQLKAAVDLLKDANSHMELAFQGLKQIDPAVTKSAGKRESPEEDLTEDRGTAEYPELRLRQIGVIRTPYTDDAPYQPVEEDEGDFRLEIHTPYRGCLHRLEEFRYIYVIYYIDRTNKKLSATVSPPWTDGEEVGVFASRSPVRPNPIGISIVRVKEIRGNQVFTSGMDAFDLTPLLDIKPYIKDLDSKPDANYGWLDSLDDDGHLLLHIRGIPHDY